MSANISTCTVQILRYSSLVDISVIPGMFGLVFGLFGMLVYDGERVRESGMLQGYNTVTWTVVALQVTTWERRVCQINCPSSRGDRLFLFVDQTGAGALAQGRAFIHLLPRVCCFFRRWEVWS